MAPVVKRLTISETGSTSSSGTGVTPFLKVSWPRRVMPLTSWCEIVL